jgi:hypothetical protein
MRKALYWAYLTAIVGLLGGLGCLYAYSYSYGLGDDHTELHDRVGGLSFLVYRGTLFVERYPISAGVFPPGDQSRLWLMRAGWTVVPPWAVAAIPLWFPGFVLVLLGGARYWVVAWSSYRRRRRRRRGVCVTCGYDLTGNVSGVCPECGTAVPPSAESKPKESP